MSSTLVVGRSFESVKKKLIELELQDTAIPVVDFDNHLLTLLQFDKRCPVGTDHRVVKAQETIEKDRHLAFHYDLWKSLHQDLPALYEICPDAIITSERLDSSEQLRTLMKTVWIEEREGSWVESRRRSDYDRDGDYLSTEPLNYGLDDTFTTALLPEHIQVINKALGTYHIRSAGDQARLNESLVTFGRFLSATSFLKQIDQKDKRVIEVYLSEHDEACFFMQVDRRDKDIVLMFSPTSVELTVSEHDEIFGGDSVTNGTAEVIASMFRNLIEAEAYTAGESKTNTEVMQAARINRQAIGRLRSDGSPIPTVLELERKDNGK